MGSIPQTARAGQLQLSAGSGLETRGLHALTREKAADGFAMHAKDAPDAHSVEPAVVDQAADRLRMDTQLVRNFTNTDETRIAAGRGHASKPKAGRRGSPALARRPSPSRRTSP